MTVIHLDRSSIMPLQGLQTISNEKAKSERLEKAYIAGYEGKESILQKLIAFFRREDRNIAILMFKEFGAAVKNFQRTDIGESEKIQFKLRAMSIIASLREKVSCGTLEHFDALVAPKLALLALDFPDMHEVTPEVMVQVPVFRSPREVALRADYKPAEFVSMNVQDARMKERLEAERSLAELTRSASDPIIADPPDSDPISDHDYVHVQLPTSKPDGLEPTKSKNELLFGLVPLRDENQFLCLYEVSSGPGDFNGAPASILTSSEDSETGNQASNSLPRTARERLMGYLTKLGLGDAPIAINIEVTTGAEKSNSKVEPYTNVEQFEFMEPDSDELSNAYAATAEQFKDKATSFSEIEKQMKR